MTRFYSNSKKHILLDRVTDQSEMFINKKHFDNTRG